jgi:hypothetical protein
MGAYEDLKDRATEELAEDDRMLVLLEDIRDAVAEGDQSYWDYGADEPSPGESDTGRPTANYGYLSDITATAEIQGPLNLGRVADTVVIRNFSDELDIAFKDPNQNEDDAFIPIAAADEPFVIAGVYGIATQALWYRQGDGAAGNHTFDVLAVKNRGRD